MTSSMKPSGRARRTVVLRRGTLALGLAATLLAGCASFSGDQQDTAFYQYSEALPTQPGTLLRSAPLPASLGLDRAVRQERILYTSTDGGSGHGQQVTSGVVFYPHGEAPAGGWPIVAWAHGTVGISDNCAPSRNVRTERDASYLNAWLDQGFVVVATDYQGLGTAGPHLYLNTRAEAYAVLDSVRAALGGMKNLSNRVILVGQSQGGGAAFATAGFAPQYAPDINVLGTVATGTPDLAHLGPSPYKPNDVNPTLAYNMYVGHEIQTLDPSIAASDLYQAGALPVYQEAATTCVHELEKKVQDAGLSNANTLKPKGWKKGLPALGHSLFYITYHLQQPLFMGTGSVDKDVSTQQQLELAKRACAAGTLVQQHVYEGLSHSPTVNASLADSIPFVKRLLAGEAVQSTCQSGPVRD